MLKSYGSLGEFLKVIMRKTDNTIDSNVDWDTINWSEVKEIGLKTNTQVIGFHRDLGCITWYPLFAYTYDKPLFYIFEKAWGRIGTTWHNFYITTSNTARTPYLTDIPELHLPDERQMGWTGTIPYSGYNFPVDVAIKARPMGQNCSLKTKITTPIALSNIGIEYQFYLNPEYASDAERNVKWVRVYTSIDVVDPENSTYTDYDILSLMSISIIPLLPVYVFEFFNQDKSKCLGSFNFTDVFIGSNNRFIDISQVTLPNQSTTYCLRIGASFGSKPVGGTLEIDPDYGHTNEWSGALTTSAWRTGVTKNEHIMAEPITVTEDGDLKSIYAFLKYSTAADEANAAIYNSDGTLLATCSATQSVSNSSYQWYTFSFSPKPRVTNGSSYYICIFGDAPDSDPGVNAVYIQTAQLAAGGTSYYTKQNQNTFPTFPSTITLTLISSKDLSIYCTVESLTTGQTDSDVVGKIALVFEGYAEDSTDIVGKGAEDGVGSDGDSNTVGKVYSRSIEQGT